MMFSSGCQYTLLAVFLLSIALLVSCAADPVTTGDDASFAIQPSKTSRPDVSGVDDLAAKQNANVIPVEKSLVTESLINQSEATNIVDQFANGKKLSIPKVTGSVPPRDDKYHDTDNNAIIVLQSPTQAMVNFPRDRRKEVDWVQALDQGFIEPRANLLGGDDMVTMDLDIVMKNTQFMPWVRFPHLAHTKWLACQNCHPKIFIPQEHANPISMNKVLRGEYCGVCHDKVSFSLFICERCHSVPHEGSGPAWWKE